jgi:hypothetical protein
MSGQDELVAVGGESIQHPGAGGMGDGKAEVCRAVGRSGDGVVAVAAEVRVVDAGGDIRTFGDLPADGIEIGVVGGEEDGIEATHDAKLFSTPEDGLATAAKLGLGERGRYMVAATFGGLSKRPV